MTLYTGQVINNRYRIVKLLGQGGFGAVYRAWDMNFQMPCALKENFDTSPDAQAQFLREAQMLRTLRHPNLPLVADYFPLPGQGQYLVMDYIEGEDLQSLLQSAGSNGLPENKVLPWITQVLDALDYLHQQSPPIIHRDIKPANIKITPQGKAVLVDFGIAKIHDPLARTATGARAVTPGFSPFEQYGSAPTDARSDVYALGATLYAALTGQQPVESINRIGGQELLAPRSLNPQISLGVEQAVLNALQLMPPDRFQSAAEFKSALLSPAWSVVPTPVVASSSQPFTSAVATQAAPPSPPIAIPQPAAPIGLAVPPSPRAGKATPTTTNPTDTKLAMIFGWILAIGGLFLSVSYFWPHQIIIPILLFVSGAFQLARIRFHPTTKIFWLASGMFGIISGLVTYFLFPFSDVIIWIALWSMAGLIILIARRERDWSSGSISFLYFILPFYWLFEGAGWGNLDGFSLSSAMFFFGIASALFALPDRSQVTRLDWRHTSLYGLLVFASAVAASEPISRYTRLGIALPFLFLFGGLILITSAHYHVLTKKLRLITGWFGVASGIIMWLTQIGLFGYPVPLIGSIVLLLVGIAHLVIAFRDRDWAIGLISFAYLLLIIPGWLPGFAIYCALVICALGTTVIIIALRSR